MRKLSVIGAIALTAGCAVDQSPEAQCRYFVREEGLRWVRDIKSAPAAGGGTAVTMQMEDVLNRSFNATCIYKDGKRHWAEPLPSNAVRDTFGRSFH
jgi:hypothetical protein